MPGKLPLASALLVLLLAACAGPQSRPTTSASWEDHSARLRELTVWAADGKLALRSPQQSESASFQWSQHGVITRLYLSGPLGVAATSLYSDGKTLTVRQGEDVATLDLTDSGELERRTGWDLPLLALPHWLKGLPAPGLAVQRMEPGPDPALLQVLQQDNWEIHFDDYANYGEMTLPTRLTIQRRDTTVRLIIRNWEAASR